MKILVTGANGLLGSNLTRELLDRGHQVRAFITEGESNETIKDLDIISFSGDILKYRDLLSASIGIDAIYHLASEVSTGTMSEGQSVELDIKGTNNLIKLARERDVERFIYVGSAGSVSGSYEAEQDTLMWPEEKNPYGFKDLDSGHIAQQCVLQSAKDGVPAIVVNPTIMIGPYETGRNPGSLLMAVFTGRMPGYISGGRNFINVKDAAIGVANALTKGRIGESYILGHQNLSYREAFHKMAEIAEVKPPQFAVPSWMITAYGCLLSFYAFLSGTKPVATYPMMHLSCRNLYYSSKKAVKELELPQTPLEEGIRESFDWFRRHYSYEMSA